MTSTAPSRSPGVFSENSGAGPRTGPALAAGVTVAAEVHAAVGARPAGVPIAPERVASSAATRSGVRATVANESAPETVRTDGIGRPGLPVVVAGTRRLPAVVRVVSAGRP